MLELKQLNNNVMGEWQNLLTSFSNHNTGSETKYNLSDEIPQLSKIIEDHPLKNELETEIKNLAMKFYWNGFYQGKSCHDK